ncbi:2-C-methyl-D-erythritol 4-phosphate cytidylyltransferase, partial [Erwinia amylovora]|uniref:2-C-methyl-D-erythritol 4-phosphate cytidylyltransferase n=1 Tax=Erwinia amylovora TaxID=552 RepID=UPI00200B0128
NLISLSNVVAVVPAAGIGIRMLSGCPKQYLTICGKTILEHSLAALLAHPAVSRVVVALSTQDSHFHQLPIARDARVSAVTGGLQRAVSVLAGFQAAS